METNVNYTIIGVFVIAIISFIVVAIIWLSAGLNTEQNSIYKVYMQESVSGLSPDSVVEYNGVNVGGVKSIELNRRNPQLVELLLKIKSSTPITRGTKAKLNAKGLTGITFIELIDKGTDTAPLVAAPGDTYPVITTAPSFFLQLDTALKQLSDNFRVLSNSVRGLLDQENVRSFKAILNNIKVISATAAANGPQVSAILRNTSAATQQLSPAIQSFSSHTLPQADQAFGNINSATKNIADFSEELKNNPSMLLRGKANRALGPGE
jgi:phospholipid/cholesterol/gamma-HCH transport system substrate-binding protein